MAADDAAAEQAPQPGPVDEIVTLAARTIAIAENATSTQADIVDQQGKLARQQRRIRHILQVLAVSLAVDLTLSVVVLFLAHNQAGVSHSIHQSQLAACAIGNKFRQTQTQVWEHVLAFSTAPPDETAAQRAKRLGVLQDFQSYLNDKFRAVDCTALYGK